MTLSLYTLAIGTFVTRLVTLSELLAKGGQSAAAKGFDPAVLVEARLAPDMFPLGLQVKIACDTALGCAAWLRGIEPVRRAPTDRTLDDLQSRIAATIGELRGVEPADIDGAAERIIIVPLFEDMVLEMTGFDYVRDWALPHFYFHIVTSYDILRHNGVELGKRDYMSHAAGAIRRRGGA